jgi:transcriptional regulator with XRE-family HTH domain
MAVTLTDFGKTLRKLRIDHDVNLKNMADGLGVTSAFLSGVETGRKAINPGLINKISEILNLSDAESLELNSAARYLSKLRMIMTQKLQLCSLVR